MAEISKIGPRTRSTANGGGVARVVLSWPGPALWQNNRAHWAPRARAVKGQRNSAWKLALEAGIKRLRLRRPWLKIT